MNTALVRFFEIDLEKVGGPVLYFHPGLNEHGKPMVWRGREYSPFPIQIEGLEYDGQGRLPRPTLTVSNIDGQLGALVRAYKDLNGCKITHRTTLACFLDSVNFIEDNLEANPKWEFPADIFYFERKAEETSEYVKFELASALDLEGQRLPKRTYNANFCPHRYRGEYCNYTGDKYFDTADNEVPDEARDKCGKRLNSCECRFGKGEQLPFGGFPGVGLLAR